MLSCCFIPCLGVLCKSGSFKRFAGMIVFRHKFAYFYDMKNRQGRIWTAVVVSTLFLGSCSSMAGRYIGYRLNPDTVQTTGTIEVDVEADLQQPVTVYLDDYAVPHIQADSEYDLYFALGYMQGRDRRFQLEMFKMLAYGRLRELVGDRDKTGILKQTEMMSRMLGFYKDAEYLLREASEEDARLLEAFSAGINEATRLEPRPMEFRVLDYQPEEWKPEDSMVIFAMISFGLCKNWEHELSRLELIVHQLRIGQSIDRSLQIYKPVYELPPYLISDGAANTYSPNGSGYRSPADGGVSLISPELVSYLEAFVEDYPEPDMENPAEDAGLVYRGMDNWYRGNSASNNWAVDGSWTGTGKAALATDSHMPHMLPSMGYLFHLEKEGAYSAIGAGFTGLPAVPFGTNGNVAWGATSNWADVTDLFVEKPVSGDPDFYYFEGEAVPFEKRVETFKIRRDDGSFTEETYTVRESRHGVILNDFIERIGGDFPLLALRRNRILGEPLSALRRAYNAYNVDDARGAFEDFYGFTGHWALADVNGDIGYVGSVRLPRRQFHPGTLPVPGWIDRYEWKEYVGTEELPFIKNPPAGHLGTANNQVVDPESVSYPLNLDGSTPFRYQRIKEVLDKGSEGREISEIMSELQMDDKFMGWELLRSRFGAFLTPLLHDADPLVADASAILLEWDGRNIDTSTGPTIFNIFQIQAFIAALEDEVSPKTLHFYLSFYNMEPLVYDLLGDPENPAWDDIRTSGRETYEEVLDEAFRKTVSMCADLYGEKVEKWRWDRGATFILEHPFGTEKALAGFLNRGPLPLRGATDTLFAHQIQRSEIDHFDIKGGPVLRVVVDFGDLERSFMSLPGGQSGRPVSGHYDDILPLYVKGKGIPMLTDFYRLDSNAKGRIILY